MFRKEFVDREKELEFLNKKYSEKGFEFIVVSGRRRIGKSRMLKEFVKDKENILLLCEFRRWEYNLLKFNERIAEYFGIPNPNFKSFSECFSFIIKQNRDKKLVVVVDEFSYLIKKSDVVAEFQTIVDEILPYGEIFLILSGSAVSMMKKHVLEQKSPLYGRTTGQIFLQPLKFRDVLKWFPAAKIEDVIKIFAVCDGIPKYMEFFHGIDVENEIKENIFNPESFLFREPKLLLEEELREPETYFQILEAISLGYNKVVEIANYSFLNAKDISSYLSILVDLGFVEKEHFITDKKRARGIYKIKDNFFAFWFRFVSRYFSDIEIWNMDQAWSNFNKNFNQYLGFVFERIAKEFLLAKKPLKFRAIGRWWHKDIEIDIVTLNEETDEIGFFEVKWSGLETREARNILNALKNKSKEVMWNNKKRKEYYGIIAKEIDGKETLRNEGWICYDLDDINQQMKIS